MSSNNNWEKLFTYETLVHAVSGSMGAITAMSAFYPLDTVRSRLQLDDNKEAKDTWTMLKEIVKDEGLESLYHGLGPVLTSVCISNFVYFYSFHGLRAVVGLGSVNNQSQSNSALKNLVLGSIAGAINVLLTTPVWVVNTRMKHSNTSKSVNDKNKHSRYNYANIVDGLITIAKTEGLSALWSSTIPSLILVSNPSIQFMIYERLKSHIQMVTSQQSLSAANAFLVGAVSKCISTILTYPLQVVQSKLRYDANQYGKSNMISLMAHLIQKNGYLSLYKGLESKLLQTVLTTALMFLFYEKISAFVFAILASSKSKSA